MAGAVPLPTGSRIADLFAGADLADAYAIDLPSGSSRDIETLTRFMLGEEAPWLRLLMGVRDAVVAGFGLKTSRRLRQGSVTDGVARIYIFRVYEITWNEAILGEDDKHLDFRVSVQRRPGDIVVTTVVHCHNLLGRAYLALITPFHRLVVKSILRRAARRGWPESPPHDAGRC
ncbi:MAG: DUF2867 domain-containing protein [Reyranella sp.]|nr:DUF2867 domain-containing protein [Reyranella sp.]